jgi:hypothetical protein
MTIALLNGSWLEHGRKRLLGESIREIGVLMLVFVPIDGYFRESKGPGRMIESHYLRWLNLIGRNNFEIAFFAVFGIALLFTGIYVEREAELALENSTQETL